MKRIFILLALFILMHSEKNNHIKASALNKFSLNRNDHFVHNRHKPYGSDVWPGKIIAEN